MPPVNSNNIPKTTRQQVNPAQVPQRMTGILSRAIPISQLPETHIKAIVYGVNRVGKTTWSCQFPKPLLLVDCEPAKDSGGAKSVRKMQGVTFLKLEDTDSLRQLAEELITHNPFKTVVIDSVTSLERIVLAEIMKLPAVKDLVKPSDIGLGPAGMDIYMKRSDMMRKLLRLYLDHPCHTVFTAKEKDHNPNKGDMRSKVVRGHQEESFYGPDLGGGTVEWLRDACDYIMQLTIQKEVITRQIKMGDDVIERQEETGKTIRRLRTTYHPNYAVGIRSENPESVPEFIDNPTFDKFLAMINGTYKG
jgi:hypothetical protein